MPWRKIMLTELCSAVLKTVSLSWKWASICLCYGTNGNLYEFLKYCLLIRVLCLNSKHQFCYSRRCSVTIYFSVLLKLFCSTNPASKITSISRENTDAKESENPANYFLSFIMISVVTTWDQILCSVCCKPFFFL